MVTLNIENRHIPNLYLNSSPVRNYAHKFCATIVAVWIILRFILLSKAN